MCRRLLHEAPERGSPRQRDSSQAHTKRHSVVKQEMRRASTDPVSSHGDPNTKPKRRIQLACTRCRQRKIRCSGESPEGLGCEKCREANNVDCVFLRAGSTAIEAQQSTQVYRTLHPMMSSSSNLVTTMVPSPYGSDSLQSLPAAMSTSSSPMLHTTQSQSLSDMGGHYSPPSPWPRTGPVYQVSSLVEDVYAAPYDSSSSSAYVHPGSSAISYTGGGYRSSSPPSREWEASGSMLQSAVLYSEPDIAPSSSTRQNSSPSSDIPSLFPVVNMLSTGDAPIIGGASSSTNDSELIGSGLPFMASEYFAYPMHRPNSTTTSFRPRSSSTSITSVVPPLKSDLSTSPFYVNDPHGSSSAVTAAAAVPMNPVYDTVEQSNPSEGSLVMSSMSAGLKESPSESGSYEYVNGEQHYGNVEADNSSTSAILGNQQEYDHFKKSNDDPAVTYNDAFEGFLQ